MRNELPLVVCLCLLSAAAGGCRLFNEDAVVQGRSPLQPARPSPDSVMMEIIWARFPADDPALGPDAWVEIDETRLPPSVRRELADNGLRAGVIGTHLPESIACALDRGESPSDDAEAAASGQTVQLTAEPTVRGRVQRLRRNQRSEIQASEVYSSLPLLVNSGRELNGRTYQQAQAIYALRVNPQPDRTVIVELTPELHHGAARVRLTGGEEGVMRMDSSKQREVFNGLRMAVKLAPGELLMLMSLPEAGSRLGHYFHTADSAGGSQQKVIFIRLAEVPPSDIFQKLAEL